ncbi:MAG TPA: ABC transporter permease [Pyrinomonadaceae bacterium]|nr:ABC transporter permease [Pyrinomonadaceae bacterium]
MRWLNILSDRLRALLGREAVIRDIDEELRLHIELETESNVRRGMSHSEARRAALLSFGNFDVMRDAAYGVRGGGLMETIWQDVRYGARVLAKHKGFTIVAVLTLALGIGANTAIFSVVNELLLRPLPYRDAASLVMLWEVSPSGNRQNNISRANFRAWREQSKSFESMAAFYDNRLNLTGVGEPEELSVQLATPELFHVLGVEPVLGRAFTEEDGRPGTPDVAVLSYGLWQRRFGGDRGVVGKPVMLNGAPVTVVGVMPQDFQWHIRAKSGTGRPAEMWSVLPMPDAPPDSSTMRGRFLSAVARLKPGVTHEQADAEMKTIAARTAEDSPRHNKGRSADALPVREQFVGDVRSTLWLLLGAVGFVLLIACANVANLLLARAASREKEIAVRTALGARRSRIVRQLLTESILLAALGAFGGLALAWWGIQALVAISPRDLVNIQGVGLNMTVLGWTLGVALLTGILFGLVPALEATRVDLNDTLKEGGKGSSGQSARSRALRSVLVVSEVALALVLLVSAGLLVKSFVRMRSIDTGFDTENILTMVVRLPSAKYTEDAQQVAFFRQALERVRALPGVRSAGMVNFLPLYGGLASATSFTIDGQPEPPPGERPGTGVRVADSDYFATMKIPLLRGRNFTDSESAEARHVVVVSDSFARKFFPGQDPVGRRVSINMFEEPNPTEIIGVVGDVRSGSVTKEDEPTAYFPHSELTYPFMTLTIRTAGDPAEMAPAVRREISSIDPDQPVSDVRTMTQVMADTVGRARFSTLLFGLFAGLATLLAAVGIFGVMNYSVTLRTREIGLRMALGAQPARVLVLVLRQGLVLTLAGIGIGLLGALALTRVMSSLLFGVDATDPLTFAAIVPLVAVVSLIACYIPARRATRIDPLVALRYE